MREGYRLLAITDGAVDVGLEPGVPMTVINAMTRRNQQQTRGDAMAIPLWSGVYKAVKMFVDLCG